VLVLAYIEAREKEFAGRAPRTRRRRLCAV
jgi:hypothetical protein